MNDPDRIGRFAVHLHHEHTGVRCWRSHRLPGPPLSIHRVTAAEALVWLLVVGLASVPLLLWSQRAPWAWAMAGLALAVTACLLWAQRVAVGADWVAVRRYLRWHVVSSDRVARLLARPSQRGGVVRVDCDDGSHLVLHRGELADLEPARSAWSAAMRYVATVAWMSCSTCDSSCLTRLPPPVTFSANSAEGDEGVIAFS